MADEINSLVHRAARYLSDADHAAFFSDVRTDRDAVFEKWLPRLNTEVAAWESTPLEEGLLVELHSLSRNELNGLHGYCGVVEAESGRRGVELLRAEKTRTIAVKPENLRRAPPSPRHDRAKAKELADAADARLNAARGGSMISGVFDAGFPADARTLCKEAVALMEQAAALDPAGLMVHSNRCDLAIMTQQRGLQAQHAKRGIANATRPADQAQRINMRLALASALGEMGDCSGAMHQCRAVLAAQPENLMARLNLGMALNEQRNPASGNDEEATVQLMMALQLPTNDEGDGDWMLRGSRDGGLSATTREMALDDLMFTLTRRRQRLMQQAADSAEAATAMQNVEAQLMRLIERYPEAARRCAQRGQERAAMRG